jgi:hypothetical protein
MTPTPAPYRLQPLQAINVPKASTDGLTSGTYNYDVQQVDDSANVQTLLIGKVKVVKDITRST